MRYFYKVRNYSFIVILICLFSNFSWAKKHNQTPKLTQTISVEKAVQELLLASRWDMVYDRDRKIDVEYILGDVSGEKLEGLDKSQREQVKMLMQSMVLDQMEKDKSYFRKYVVEQYTQFFTLDEVITLTKYFNTELIQMLIYAKIENKNLQANEIKDKLIHSKETDKQSISYFSSSYLYMRYFRFQDKLKPLLDKMIVDRLKEVLDVVIAAVPELVEEVKRNPSSK